MSDLYAKLKQFRQNTTEAPSKPAAGNPPESPAPSGGTAQPAPASQSESGIYAYLKRGRDLVGAAQRRDEQKRAYLFSIGMQEDAAGAYAVRELVYPHAQVAHGLDEIDSCQMARLANDEAFHAIDARQVLYLDTETTGLAGGAGTVPFLIGLGWFAAEGFRVRQYLMRDYDEESAVLEAIHNSLDGFAAVASYNGKRFDLPLLETRFLLQRQWLAAARWPHLDLLYPVRRIWRDVLPDCRLGRIESVILGRERAEDLPSELIPYVYFDFLRGQRMHRMKPVITHNAEDIVSLASLTGYLCRLLRDPQRHGCQPAELIGASTWHSRKQEWKEALRLLECACEQGHEADRALLWRMAMLHKRLRQWQEAVSLWRRLAEDYADRGAWIELAKAYEHRLKQLPQALVCTERAMQCCEREMTPPALEASLQNRYQRLQRKLALLKS